MPKCWAFDVDETLELSNGPVTLAMMEELRNNGEIVGICGNMNVFCKVPDWHKRISFLGQGFLPKEQFLWGIKINVTADEHIMVGNILGVSGHSDDKGAVERINAAVGYQAWRFIQEIDFANGAR